MKNMKKILALLVAVLMIAASVSAFADVPTSQTIDPSSAADADGKYQISVASSDDHTYQVFQILTGTLIAGESKLGNPKWGADAKGTAGTDTGVKEFMDAITASGLSNVAINDLVEGQLATNAAGQGTVKAGTPLNVVPGYYLIKDVTPNTDLAAGEAKSLNIVAVFNDIQITPKQGTTESEKHVDDVNDSTTAKDLLKDSSDYDIGDSVPYTLTFKLPADYANYKKYYVSFVDDMSAGLTYNGDAKIYYGTSDTTGTDIGSAFAVDSNTTSDYTGGKVYRYTIADLKTGTDTQKALTAGAVITIKYTATLNSSAVTGATGNPNKYKVTYSRNPNEGGNGTPETGDTPWDINITFTYKTVFNKVDNGGKPLTGANFTLYKFIASETGTVTYKETKGEWVDVTTLGGSDNHPSKTTEGLTNEKGTAENAKFTFKGIDDGWYKLVESATPTGYNTLADQYFTVTAEHQLEADNPTLTSLTGAEGAEFTMTSNLSDGSLTADSINTQGAELPSTGGIGTTLFYIGGGILVLAAVILLVTKRRMSSND